MDYATIIKKSWYYFSKYRYLWWLGILAAMTEIGGVGASRLGNYTGGFNLPNTDQLQSRGEKVSESLNNVPRILGVETYPDIWTKFVNSIIEHWQISLAVVLVLILLGVLIMYISFSAKSGLILGIDRLESGGKEDNSKTLFKSGTAYAWRLVGLSILIGLILIVCMLIPVVIAISLFFDGLTAGMVPRMIFLLVILLLIIPFSVYMSLVVQIAQRIVVLENQGTFVAFNHARTLIGKKFWTSIVTYLVDIGLTTVYGIISALIIGIPAIIMIAVALVSGDGGVGAITGVIVITMIILLFLLLLFSWFLAGLFSVFNASYWTIVYRALEFITNQPQEQPVARA